MGPSCLRRCNWHAPWWQRHCDVWRWWCALSSPPKCDLKVTVCRLVCQTMAVVCWCTWWHTLWWQTRCRGAAAASSQKTGDDRSCQQIFTLMWVLCLVWQITWCQRPCGVAGCSELNSTYWLFTSGCFPTNLELLAAFSGGLIKVIHSMQLNSVLCLGLTESSWWHCRGVLRVRVAA